MFGVYYCQLNGEEDQLTGAKEYEGYVFLNELAKNATYNDEYNSSVRTSTRLKILGFTAEGHILTVCDDGKINVGSLNHANKYYYKVFAGISGGEEFVTVPLDPNVTDRTFKIKDPTTHLELGELNLVGYKGDGKPSSFKDQ